MHVPSSSYSSSLPLCSSSTSLLSLLFASWRTSADLSLALHLSVLLRLSTAKSSDLYMSLSSHHILVDCEFKLYAHWLTYIYQQIVLLTQGLLELKSTSCVSLKSTLQVHLEKGIRLGGVSSDGESNFISLASFNVPSVLHASPMGFVESCWTRVSIWSSSI